MKRFRSVIFFLTLVLVMCPVFKVNASEWNGDTQVGDIPYENLPEKYKKAINVFYDSGYSEWEIAAFPLEDLLTLSEYLEEDPDSVTINTTTNNYDEISQIELAVNLSEEDLIHYCGISKNEAEEVKETISELRGKSEKELERAGYSAVTAKLICEALIENEDYQIPKNIDEPMTLSSTISSSQLTFTQTIVNKSTSSRAIYGVSYYWYWNECYYPWGFEDRVAISWGGDLVYDTNYNTSALAYYNYMNGVIGNFGWGDYYGFKKVPIVDETTNGLIFGFPTEWGITTIYNKLGKIDFVISNNKKQNKSTNIYAQYCHKVLKIGSASIAIKSVGISVGSGYNTSDLTKTTKTITY